mmetsp:Transcript_24738/g.71440  ORF Transcript_24738/g.71440 Transcript_24738/m.71440 type:complete len:440 (-) Transcript_24738:34-1353(-)
MGPNQACKTLHQELQEVRKQLASEKAAVAAVTRALRAKEVEVETLRGVVHDRAIQKWTPHVTEKLGSSLSDCADHPLFAETFRRAKLNLFLSLDPKERAKVSISAFVYVYLDGAVNTEQLCAISRAEVPPDPETVFYSYHRHIRDIESKKPPFTESMISLPEGSSQHCIDQVLSGYRVGTQFCFQGDPLQKKKNRLQFNIKESDKALIVLAALDPSLSCSTLKSQVSYLRSSDILTTPMPTIVEEEEAWSALLSKEELFGAGGSLGDTTSSASSTLPVNDDSHTISSQDEECAGLSINSSILDGEPSPDDAGSISDDDPNSGTRFGDDSDDDNLPLNGLIVTDGSKDDDVSTIATRESFIPTDVERRRAIILMVVDDEVAELAPSDRVTAKQVILEAANSLPSDLTSQAIHIGQALVEALPKLCPVLLCSKASRLVATN